MFMTERLYYDNAYLTEFDAMVEKADMKGDKQIVALNRSAFYPTSGGQPYDTGTLNDARVTDVFVDKQGEVWHQIEGTLAVGEHVHGKIDWVRRFDHMQQHGGEHMIAGAIYNLTGGMTIGLHLGAEVSSIDVEFADGATHMSDELIAQVADYVNERIQQDLPVKLGALEFAAAQMQGAERRRAQLPTIHFRGDDHRVQGHGPLSFPHGLSITHTRGLHQRRRI